MSRDGSDDSSAVLVSPMAPLDGTPAEVVRRRGTVHVVCFEDCGACTLREIVRVAVLGDDVVVLGPEAFARTLVELGLSREIGLTRVGRVAGRWRRSEVARVVSKLDGGWQGKRTTVLYGRAILDARIAGDEVTKLARLPAELPVIPPVPEGRRSRIRRELCLAPQDVAILVANEPANCVDLGLVARAVGMAHVALVGHGVRLRLIASPETPRVFERACFLRDAVGAPDIVVDPRVARPWELLCAVDAVLIDQDGLASDPVSCAGDRCRETIALGPTMPSPLPALWSLAAELPTFVHTSIALGVHDSGPRAGLVHRFGDDVAALSRALYDFARSRSAASR